MNVNPRLAGAGACAIVRLTTLVLTLVVCSIVTFRAALDESPHTGMADPAALEAAYDRFARTAQPDVVVLPLANLRGLSSEAVNAGGAVTIDLARGIVTTVVRGLSTQDSFELWLVDNRLRPDHSTLAEDDESLINVGRIESDPAGNPPSVRLDPNPFTTFFPDRAFVVRAGDNPVGSFVLTGSSTLFTRLLHHRVRLADFERLAAQGRQLFLDETFNGNGRTCGTCHVETNNFTLDPELIATLPPDNPLFVAETNPALATLEDAALMRRLGLILVNADGFDPDDRGPQFVLRATQNVQALANSSLRPPDGSIDFTVNGPNPNPSERLGWGNDGAPLRDFALVAIAQHAPQTLSRARGTDFRVPTDDELDALAAYQLPLGRQEDFDLPALSLNSALARSGKTLYLDTGNMFERGHKNCNACHFNGGGSAAMSFIPSLPDLDGRPTGANMTGETNVNAVPLALSLGLPRDGGFGQVFLSDFRSFGNRIPVLPRGLEGFNTPPVVESADTAPFFHNHTIADLESAVAFYGTPAFQTSIFGPVIPVTISPDPGDPEVQAIAAFLRVLNALENIRSSINVAERGRRTTRAGDMRDLARLAAAETDDAIEVLSDGAFATSIEPSILSARALLRLARLALGQAAQLDASQAIDNLLGVAVTDLRAARGRLASPATLPPSFRN